MLSNATRNEKVPSRHAGQGSATGILTVIALLSASFPLLAHHGTTVTYDSSKSITLNGTVTAWDYVFPHPALYFDVIGADGKVEHWGSETAQNPAYYARDKRSGIHRNSIKPGDKIQITCSPNRAPGAKSCLAREVTINGKLLGGMGFGGGQNNPAPAAPTGAR